MIKISTLIIAAVFFTQSFCAQSAKPYFGWDLTYESVLEKNNVDRNEWIWKWLNFTYKDGFNGKFETPAKKWISEWKGEPIISSVLIDFPAFHATEHYTVWLFRTKNNAYHWEYIDEGNPHFDKKDLDLKDYDKIFEQISVWEQNKPQKPEETHPDDLPGYIGFLSSYEKGKSREMLLTREDFIICENKECDKKKSGRLLDVYVSLIAKENP